MVPRKPSFRQSAAEMGNGFVAKIACHPFVLLTLSPFGEMATAVFDKFQWFSFGFASLILLEQFFITNFTSLHGDTQWYGTDTDF
jgi:hypothetical protein